MKLKLDLHPIYNDSRTIESELQRIIDEALRNRITEVEIIPGKGSGQLKKAVLRFLERPDIKAKYHRIEKDGDNWGRLFVHFRWERIQEGKAAPTPRETASYACFCCGATVSIPVSAAALQESGAEIRQTLCPSCDSPNRLTLRCDRRGQVYVAAESGYG
jgi:DNA-directed RNA polymerase subunit RPC12/RpoP